LFVTASRFLEIIEKLYPPPLNARFLVADELDVHDGTIRRWLRSDCIEVRAAKLLELMVRQVERGETFPLPEQRERPTHKRRAVAA
jgi:hypothetical protein